VAGLRKKRRKPVVGFLSLDALIPFVQFVMPALTAVFNVCARLCCLPPAWVTRCAPSRHRMLAHRSPLHLKLTLFARVLRPRADRSLLCRVLGGVGTNPRLVGLQWLVGVRHTVGQLARHTVGHLAPTAQAGAATPPPPAPPRWQPASHENAAAQARQFSYSPLYDD